MCAVSGLLLQVNSHVKGADSVGDDIPWIRSLTKLPLIIKGIQCIEVSDRYKVK